MDQPSPDRVAGGRVRGPVVVLLAVLVLAGVARLAGTTVQTDLQIDPDPPRPTAPATVAPPSPDVMAGGWDPLPAADIPARTRHNAVWTGSQLLVYGGQPDPGEATGARLDPVTGRWLPMATSPLGSRAAASAVWTGQEMIIFQGVPVGAVAATVAATVDGGAYDPVTDTWRLIADAPVNPRTGHAAVWTGTEMAVFGGLRTIEHQAPLALYDPATDSWRLSSPSPLERAFGTIAMVWTGEEIVIWSGTGDTDVAAWSPTTDTWRLLPGSPIEMRSVSAVWTGTEMLLLGTPTIDLDTVGGAALDPAQGRWTVLPSSPQRVAATVAAVWTGHEAVVVGGPRAEIGAAWVPSQNRWRRLPPSPQPAFSGHSATWTGSQVVLWGGQGDSRPLGTGAAWTPAG